MEVAGARVRRQRRPLAGAAPPRAEARVHAPENWEKGGLPRLPHAGELDRDRALLGLRVDRPATHARPGCVRDSDWRGSRQGAAAERSLSTPVPIGSPRTVPYVVSRPQLFVQRERHARRPCLRVRAGLLVMRVVASDIHEAVGAFLREMGLYCSSMILLGFGTEVALCNQLFDCVAAPVLPSIFKKLGQLRSHSRMPAQPAMHRDTPCQDFVPPVFAGLPGPAVVDLQQVR